MTDRARVFDRDYAKAVASLPYDPHVENPAHCDTLVLHAPGECEFCEKRPDLQRLREQHGINFTGHHEAGKKVCPSERLRPVEKIERWGGNRPSPPGEKPIGTDYAGYTVHQSWIDRRRSAPRARASLRYRLREWYRGWTQRFAGWLEWRGRKP